ncbi:hypothetical protein IMX26_15430 [Clostridium sp. 'deep sea']|uniref:hypothetical protein n=1 Tax=Clostridium sp. 'deep sea' TaxID=2779445 RepID=UPI0018964F8D|nr:hypothetical protein [Clostridium sp. 'deep sea']QOR34833.1 hypothetical protein IMX26_15430 [Clostridium sp. 'deep sea']
MGYRIRTFKNLPKHFNFYFILIGDYSNCDKINNLFNQDFDKIADRLETSAIVKSVSNRSLDEEVYKAFEKIINDKNHHYNNLISSLESSYPGLLILDCHPDNINDKSLLLFITFDTLNNEYTSNNELIKDLVDLAKKINTNIINRFSKKKGFLTRFFDSMILEPNFFGFGFNLKEILNIKSK